MDTKSTFNYVVGSCSEIGNHFYSIQRHCVKINDTPGQAASSENEVGWLGRGQKIRELLEEGKIRLTDIVWILKIKKKQINNIKICIDF